MFAAESPQEPLPYGRWAEALGAQFAGSAAEGVEIEVSQIAWFPERTWAGLRRALIKRDDAALSDHEGHQVGNCIAALRR